MRCIGKEVVQSQHISVLLRTIILLWFEAELCGRSVVVHGVKGKWT